MRRIRPWMVVVALASVGIVGAATVFLQARAQHRRDRASVVRWQRVALPLIADAAALRADIDAAVRRVDRGAPAGKDLARLRHGLEVARRELLASKLPKLAQPAAAQFLSGIARMLQAVTALEERASSAVLP